MVFCSVILGFWLSPSFLKEVIVDGSIDVDVYPVAIGMALSVGVSLLLMGFGERYIRLGGIEVCIRNSIAIIVGMAGFSAIYGLLTNQLYGRYVLMISLVLCCVLINVYRMIIDGLWVNDIKRILYVGGQGGWFVFNKMIKETAKDVDLIKAVECDFVNGNGNGLEYFVGICKNEGITDIVLEDVDKIGSEMSKVLMGCIRQGYNVLDISAFYEKYFRMVYMGGVTERWFWRFDSEFLQPTFYLIKRSMDVCVSLFGMMVAIPVGLVIALLIKIEDRGAVFYSQERTGLRGRVFRIYKFRTMKQDAELGGVKWAGVRDARVTRIGKILRLTRVDELPQFWNIFVGDMSFIGPRPERPEMITNIEKEVQYFDYRHLIKPGLTGWAQINYPYGASVEDAKNKLAYDLYYVKYASIFLDLIIMIRTVIAMVKGAR